MVVAIARRELDASGLRRAAARLKDADAARRMLALALVLDGHTRADAAGQCGMDRQTLRDGVHRYNEHGLPGLSGRVPPGSKPRPTTGQEAEVAQWVRQGPTLAEHGVVRWRRIDLSRQIKARFGVRLAGRRVGDLLRRLGFRRLSARPRHPGHDAAAQEAHKKILPTWSPTSSRRARGKPIELWWQDEARVGQQGTLTRMGAKRGSRPPAPRDCRHDWAYIFGAVCPARGIGAALVLPHANIEAMNLHLAEISRRVASSAHAVVVVGGAGWHKIGGHLIVPDNINLLVLPPCSPELNPRENIWQYLRQNHLSNRVFDTYNAIADACCNAWNSLIATPDRITSIATRNWAQTVKV